MDSSSHGQDDAEGTASSSNRDICPYCQMEIMLGARKCRHCQEFIRGSFVRKVLSHEALSVLLAFLAVFLMYFSNRLFGQANQLSRQANELSHQSQNLAALQVDIEQSTSRRRFIIDTLREMQQVQNELQRIMSKVAGIDNLTEGEMMLLNYYEVLSKTFAENVNKDPSLFVHAKCNHEDSVRLRAKPTASSPQIGGVARDQRVTVLGTFSYNTEIKWYYVITGDNQIGWGYRYFQIE